MKKFYVDNYSFVNYGTEYFLSCIVFLTIGVMVIWYGLRCRNRGVQDRFHISFIFFYLLLQLSKSIIHWHLGVFDVREDLPLYLCNMMPFFMFWAFYRNNKKVFKIFAFWILAGSFQSIITPTLEHSYPHYEYFRYWFIHSGITISVLYGFIVYKWKLTFRDGWLSLLWLNIFAAVIYVINHFLGSNYFYLKQKPPGANLYSLLNDWPWYIFQLEFVAIILFAIVASPFYLLKNKFHYPSSVRPLLARFAKFR